MVTIQTRLKFEETGDYNPSKAQKNTHPLVNFSKKSTQGIKFT